VPPNVVEFVDQDGLQFSGGKLLLNQKWDEAGRLPVANQQRSFDPGWFVQAGIIWHSDATAAVTQHLVEF